MAMKTILLACVSVAAAVPQQFGTGNFNSFNFDQEVRGFNSGNSLFKEEGPTTPPVPILRQIQERNPDGSYTYGYESGDGTYKIETRYATGEVKGKYGYYDASGLLREVEYGATPGRGFEPRAEGLVVAPPTLADETYEEPAAPAAPAFVSTPAPAVETRSGQFENFAPRQQAQDTRRIVIRKRPVQQQARPVPRPAPRQPVQ